MARAVTLGFAFLLALTLLAPCDLPAQTKDDTVVYALQSDVQNWDPPNSVLRESVILGYHVFDHLAARDLKTGKVGPSLALSWKNVDDTTWEVKLRPNVKFHDGTPFGAKDVKATFDRVLNPENKLTARGNHAKIKSVEVVDDLTARFKTDGPYPVFVERLTAQVMQSEKVIREKGHEWMQENPIGTGPYKLLKWSKKQEHLLVRNEDYWGPKPAFKYVRIRIIPEQATQIAELISGGVDVIKAVPPDQMDVINKSGQARTSTSPILRTAFIQLDQAGRSGPNPFQDKRVRQAANLAVDIDAIIKHVLNGLGDRTATTVNPMAFGFDASIKPYKQDLAQAKKLLAEAGYPNGLEVGFMRTQPIVEPGLIQTSDAIVSDLVKAGIRTKQRMVGESGPFTNLVRDNKPDPMFEWSWGYYSVFDADAILYDVMTCGQPYSYYCNKVMDDLVIQGRSTLDTKKRQEIYTKIQKLVLDDAAYLFKWGLRGIWGISSRIEYEAPRDEIDRMFVVTLRKK
ncbi:MAG TPA: ABC transporter substrate-binding protein [Candidatus Dormibacteraeota bacterium]|jgi:peptide/nickel transport system substrate-binding protein|nr:ABC transporter substrate-binding protein [Candidatus Dormibacteraeota bacterium]